MPVDPGPCGNGNVQLIERKGEAPIAIVHSKGDGYDGQLHTSHFATCPEAAKHRNARTAAGVKPRARAASMGGSLKANASLSVKGPDGKPK